ncbi:MAG: FkbM family methyltransferase [Pseudomonadales bacterium]
MNTSWKAPFLKMLPRAALTRTLGDRWRLPLVRFASSPFVYALPGDTVVLGGCYQIDTIRRHLQAVGPQGRIIAIEANRESVRQLEEAMRSDPQLRGASNVTLVCKGVWERKGQTVFVTSDDDGRDYDRINDQCLDGFEVGKGSISREDVIEVDAIDNILAELAIDKVDYVVLTVNNSELAALKGLRATIDRNPQLRLYIHSVSPHPLDQVTAELVAAGFHMRVEPVNRGSRLHRIYAFDHTPAQRLKQA